MVWKAATLFEDGKDRLLAWSDLHGDESMMGIL